MRDIETIDAELRLVARAWRVARHITGSNSPESPAADKPSARLREGSVQVSITGVNLRGRFRLRDAGPDGTRATFRLSYRAPGGLLGLIADRIAARQVGRALLQSLANMRAMVEP